MGKIREYEGKDITILYDVARCYHATECIHGAPAVFKKDARPWVHPDGEDAAKTAQIIQRCPTGALHYRPKDASLNETPQPENVVTVTEDGPLLARGDFEIALSDGTLRETRAAFCRCGASANKPFCDASHMKIGFHEPGPEAANATGSSVSTGIVKFNPARNGPLLASGSLTVRNAVGETAAQLQQTAFCRCGASANKPFCDGSHQGIAFVG